MMRKRKVTSGRSQENSSIDITWNPESNERSIISTEVHRRIQNFSYKLGCYVRTPHRWLLEYRWIKRLVRSLDRFHTNYSIGRKSSRRIYVVRGDTDKTTSDIQARSFMARILDEIGQKLLSWGRSRNGQLRNQSSIMLEDTEDKSSKKPSGMLEKLETPMAPAMPCKTCKKSNNVEIRSKTDDFKSKFACILEASESTRMRMEESLPNYHEDHIAGRGYNSLQHNNLVHKFIPKPQAMKIPAAKAAVDKEWEKLEKISAWNLTKVKRKKKVIDEARTTGAKVHFASLMDICHLKNAELEAKHQKNKRSSCTPWWYCKRRFRVLCSIHCSRIISISNDSRQDHGNQSKLPGCAGQAADAVSAYTQVKIEDAHKLLKIPKSECPDIWIRLPRHEGPKSWSSMEDPVFPHERNLYGHPLAGLLWERQVEKIRLKYGWEKVTDWESLFVHREKGFLHKIGWKETQSWSDVESAWQRSWFGRTNIIPRSCIPGVYSMWTSHVTFSHWFTLHDTHLRGSSRKFGVRSAHFTPSHASSPCAHVVCLILRDFFPFLFLLSIFSPIVLFFLLAINFFHDVVDKYPAHSREWGPWHPCRERSSHTSQRSNGETHKLGVDHGGSMERWRRRQGGWTCQFDVRKGSGRQLTEEEKQDVTRNEAPRMIHRAHLRMADFDKHSYTDRCSVLNMWQIVHYINIDICTLTPTLPCRCLPCLFFFLLSLSTDRYS